MLLRRVIQHVQTENWFAVTIDFFIVVDGVFVGLQVQDWNEDRKERIEGRELLSRIHEETRGLLDIQSQELGELRIRADTLTLIGVNPVLFSHEPMRALTDQECEINAASQFNRRPSDELPVIDEILSAGRFDVLQSKAITEHVRQTP